MSTFTPTDYHRDDLDSDWEEVAAEHAALKEFREKFADCTDEQLHQRWLGLMETGLAMVGSLGFRHVKAEADAVMRERKIH